MLQETLQLHKLLEACKYQNDENDETIINLDPVEAREERKQIERIELEVGLTV